MAGKRVETRKIQSKLRNSENRKSFGRSSTLRGGQRTQVAENVDEAKENRTHGLRRMASTGSSHGKRGVDRLKQRSTNMIQQQRPSIRLRNAKPLPSRSLFQHKPRTWLGTKKEKLNKVKEDDWRNARPSGVNKLGKKEEKRGMERSSTEGAIKKSTKKQENNEQDMKRPSTVEGAIKKSTKKQENSNEKDMKRLSSIDGSIKKSKKKQENHDEQDMKRSSVMIRNAEESLLERSLNGTHHKGSSKKQTKKKEHSNKQDLMKSSTTLESSDLSHNHQQPVGRSRSAPSKVPVATEDEYDWRQYLVCTDSDWLKMW
eukprot:CAMPEP_0183729068 /NCGR_PEP_ID=MMETSP0737-20130205/29653_1 /TAXON_ID=385413 /ORGANISM="Thalassiosira miniscula, Strain CCMP1093" /LENGTH=314 /DNA_ID=CAMNT_0025961173 /DNA_START=240 /DNA_END=1184 /DNA_ORIENTATION=-